MARRAQSACFYTGFAWQDLFNAKSSPKRYSGGDQKGEGGGGDRETIPVATLLPSTRMPPALSLAAMRAILTFDGLYQMVTVKVTRQCPTDNFH